MEAPTSERTALKGSERRVRGEVPGRFRPNAPPAQQELRGGPRLRRSRLRNEALGLQQMGLLLAARTGPLVRAARQAQAPGSGVDPGSTPERHPTTHRRGPPMRRASFRSRRARTTIHETGPFKEVPAASDESEDRSPRACETLWPKRWIDRSPCEKAPARSASGRCSSTRSHRAVPSVRVRWTKIACSRSRSQPRIPRLTSRSDLPATPGRPTSRDAIREPS